MSGINEIHFEDSVYEYLKDSHLYTVRKSTDFDLDYVLDKSLLEQFIRNSQPATWLKLEKEFPLNTIEAVANEFDKLRDKRGLLNLLRGGFVLQGASIKLISCSATISATSRRVSGITNPSLINLLRHRTYENVYELRGTIRARCRYCLRTQDVPDVGKGIVLLDGRT